MKNLRYYVKMIIRPIKNNKYIRRVKFEQR